MSLRPTPSARDWVHSYNDASNDRLVFNRHTRELRTKVVIDEREAGKLEDALETMPPNYAKMIRGEIRRLDEKREIKLTAAGDNRLAPMSRRLLTAEERKRFADNLDFARETLKLVRNVESAPQFVNDRPALEKIEAKLAPEVAKYAEIVRTGRAGNTPLPDELHLKTGFGKTFDDLATRYGPDLFKQLNSLDWQHLNPVIAAGAVPLVRRLIEAAKPFV